MHNRPPISPDGVHAAVHAGFRWQVPARFNIADACCRRWARDTPDAPAVIQAGERGGGTIHTYGQLQREANRLSNALRRLGVQRGDRVAIALPQRFETAASHMAVAQLGAVALPLSMLFGPQALAIRLRHSEARAAIVDESSVDALVAARAECPELAHLIGVGAAGEGADHDWRRLLDAETRDFAAVATSADDPALLLYTSGTTGAPKGALIPHRALLGNLTGFVCSQNWFGFARERGGLASEAVMWSPADWAWTGGLMDALLPTLHFGRPIVAWQGRFSPETAFDLMARHGVTHTFLFPTALKAMMKAVPSPRSRHDLRLEAIMSAGEAVGETVFDWCRRELGVGVNEMFGQTEMNYVVGNCGRIVSVDGQIIPGWPARPGSMGKAYPGHRIAVVDEAGEVCAPGVPGDVAVHRRDVHGDPDPIFFLGYWRDERATRAKYTGDPSDSWCRTGDVATMDEDGYLWYQGRSDDMFKAAGYRIGPGEIENCLVGHPAVANVAVVPKPDADRGALVKAYVVLAPGRDGDGELVRELQEHVRGQLAPYEYPKEIEFVAALPMTATGKVQRRVLRVREEALARGETPEALPE